MFYKMASLAISVFHFRMAVFCKVGISFLSPYFVLGWLCSVNVAFEDGFVL